MKELRDKLDTLCTFRDFLMDPVISSLRKFLDNPTSPAYAGFVAALYEANELNMAETELDMLAEQFALERSGRSARLARQFVDRLLAR